MESRGKWKLVLAPGFAEDFLCTRGEPGGQVIAKAQSRLLGTAVTAHTAAVEDAVRGQAGVLYHPTAPLGLKLGRPRVGLETQPGRDRLATGTAGDVG